MGKDRQGNTEGLQESNQGMKRVIKYLKSREFKYLLLFLVVWRLTLFVFLHFSQSLPLQRNFLGGGLDNYRNAPIFWSWANFDGEHYLSIAQRGYGQGEEAFFPFYPMTIRVAAEILGSDIADYNLAGLIVSNLSFLLATVGIYKLIKLDYQKRTARAAILLLLLFPFSFYFGSVYSESLFLALSIWSFYFARQKKWLPAVILGAFSTATRFIGILLLPAFFAEMAGWKKISDIRRPLRLKPLHVALLLIIPAGLLLYMYFLKQTTGDYFYFIHTLPGFGEQRSSTPIILPQVFYRYIFRILPNINYSYFPQVFTTLSEFVVAIVFGALSLLSLFKTRLSYAAYLSLGFLIPTLSGSFSSLPRYVAVLFPGFVLLAVYFLKLKRPIQIIILSLLFILLGLATALFARGYWIA